MLMRLFRREPDRITFKRMLRTPGVYGSGSDHPSYRVDPDGQCWNIVDPEPRLVTISVNPLARFRRLK